MKIIDLTHIISEDMPVYPGTEPPRLMEANTYEKDGFKETLLHMYSHTGTHMDAPAHLFSECKSLDKLPIEQYVGKAIVIDCTDIKAGEMIALDHLAQAGSKLDMAEFLLFNTGWSKKWGTPEYFGEFPVISYEVADWIIEKKIKGIGVDVISIDPMAEEHLPRHQCILKTNNTVIVENLTNLEKIGTDICTVCFLPLKTIDADGSPIRAIALLDPN